MMDSLPIEARETLQIQLQRSFGQTVACCLLEENQPFFIHWKSSNFDILFHRNQSLFQEHSFLQYLLDEDQILFENTLHSMKSKDPNSGSFLILSMSSKDSPSSLFFVRFIHLSTEKTESKKSLFSSASNDAFYKPTNSFYYFSSNHRYIPKQKIIANKTPYLISNPSIHEQETKKKSSFLLLIFFRVSKEQSELQQSQRSIYSLQRELNDLVDLLQEGVLYVDCHSYICTKCNPGGQLLLQEDIRGQNIIDSIHPHYQLLVKQLFSTLYSQQSSCKYIIVQVYKATSYYF